MVTEPIGSTRSNLFVILCHYPFAVDHDHRRITCYHPSNILAEGRGRLSVVVVSGKGGILAWVDNEAP